MAVAKTYYWLKLNEDFFSGDETVQYIEEMENGDKYLVFYLKLMLKSLRQDGYLVRQVGTHWIPYDVNSLAKLTGMDVDTVRCAVAVLSEFGLLEMKDTGEIYMSRIHEMVGSETDKAALMRKKRERDRALCENLGDCGNNVTVMLPDSSNNVTNFGNNVTQRYRDIEIKSIDNIEDNNICVSGGENVVEPKTKKRKMKEYTEEFERFWKEYPRQKDKGKAFVNFQARIKDGISAEDMYDAAVAYASEMRKEHTPERFIKLPATFLSYTEAFRDYLKRPVADSEVVGGGEIECPFPEVWNV